ncbi:MAG: sugar ABC transporter ATP-binding protein [Desulfobacterales bacterium]
MADSCLIELKNVSKAFGGVPVLQKVNFAIRRGIVHGLVGGNGAGKSTLMKILSGVYQPDEGEIWIQGKNVKIKSPADAHSKGVYLVPQEPLLFPYLPVEENILLGTKVEIKAYRKKLKYLMDALKCDFTLEQLGADLTIAKQQLVALLRGLVRESEIIILDEPTSALTSREVNAMFMAVRDLIKTKNTAIVYITHRLQELFEITDELTILKNGKVVLQDQTENCALEDIIQIMVPKIGERETEETPINFKRMELENAEQSGAEHILEIEGLCGRGFRDISLKVKKGEIIGLTGVVGAGRTEFAEALFGIMPKTAGTVKLFGKVVNIKSPREAIELGLVYLPEDRHLHGGFLEADIKANITSSILYRLSRIFLPNHREKSLAGDFIQMLSIKATGDDQKFKYLSGGNQQKVVLAKCLAAVPKVTILDEPTRGIDANARKEIYSSIRNLASKGISVILISSDFEEIVALCDRVMVMFNERITAQLEPPNISLENITFASFGYAKVA